MAGWAASSPPSGWADRALVRQYAEKVPLAVIGGMLVVIGVELILACLPSIRLVLRSGDKGSIFALALTFVSALFIPLQYTIFLGAGLSLLLYVVASSHKLRLQQAVRLEGGEWEVHDAPIELTSGEVTVIVVQGLDFFAEVPALDDQMPPARGVANAVVVLVLRDTHKLGSTAITWLEQYAKTLQATGGILMLTDVNPAVLETLRRSGALEIIGADHVFGATSRVLAAENMAWDAAAQWLREHNAADAGKN